MPGLFFGDCSGGGLADWVAYSGSRNIWGWRWFSCGVAHGGERLVSVVLAELSLWRGDWALGYHSKGFR